MHVGIIKEEMMCGGGGATLKPLHLHNPSTSVGNMEVVDRLENVTFNFNLLYFVGDWLSRYNADFHNE